MPNEDQDRRTLETLLPTPSADPECTPGRISLTYCGVCGVSWLVGEKGPDAAASHLSHHTLVHNYSGARRSLVVFIDGACPANGPAALQASVGVYFGPESPKNISRLIDTSRPTNQLAEITAAVEAMRQVRSVVVPERRILLKGSSPRTTPDTLRDARRFRLVLATDSSYLVDCMCKYMPQWTFDNLNRNSEGFRILNEETELLSVVGVQVQWYHVPRDFNGEADALANAALRG
ncbi:ribonuclease H-like domain-containing protein [Fusarium oxysporum f. sp. albedinis]|nr:ribonuclease H-like domain-containing protein [Fusarium oxysporum f. sp. albedinis]